ncbi:MAG: hypothetical protein J6X28_02700 [Bacilli bacterium]|nr:hypothetical protein [Bacilli bacterium]
MKEAYGGVFNIIFIVIFLVIVIGVLGLVFSYTKAFKMKNAIISVIEEYEGSGCYPEASGGAGGSNTACRQKIRQKAQDLAYNPVSLNCPPIDTTSGSNVTVYKADDIYCYEMSVKTKADGKRYAVFKVITQVDISFPIVERIMGLRFFQAVGDTKEIQLQS